MVREANQDNFDEHLAAKPSLLADDLAINITLRNITHAPDSSHEPSTICIQSHTPSIYLYLLLPINLQCASLPYFFALILPSTAQHSTYDIPSFPVPSRYATSHNLHTFLLSSLPSFLSFFQPTHQISKHFLAKSHPGSPILDSILCERIGGSPLDKFGGWSASHT